MARATRQRRGIVKFLGNIVDDSKDVVDDLLDRARDVERDLRSTARKALDPDDEHDEGPATDDIAALQAALAELSAKVDQLAALHGTGNDTGQPSEAGAPAKS